MQMPGGHINVMTPLEGENHIILLHSVLKRHALAHWSVQLDREATACQAEKRGEANSCFKQLTECGCSGSMAGK